MRYYRFHSEPFDSEGNELRKSMIASFSASSFSNVDTLLFNNSTTNEYSLSHSFSFYGVPTLWLLTDKLVIKLSISSIFFSTDFVKLFIVSIFFKNMFRREIKLWVLPLYADLIGRLGVTDKSEGSKGVCWVSGIITVSRLATKLSEIEDLQSIWAFLAKLQLSS